MCKLDLPTLRSFLQKKIIINLKIKKKIDNLDGIFKAWSQENLMIDLLSQNIWNLGIKITIDNIL